MINYFYFLQYFAFKYFFSGLVSLVECNEYNGINFDRALNRYQLVKHLDDLILSRNRFIYIGSPSATGKTSLFQLYHRKMSCSTLCCKYVSLATMIDAKDILLQKTGIDVVNKSVVSGSFCDVHKGKTIVIMLDDAQNKYKDTNFWELLIKTDNELPEDPPLPRNIHFVISATYSLTTTESPVTFHDFPRLPVQNFVLSDVEVSEFFDLWRKDPTVGELLVDQVIRTAISVNCNGHMGALFVSVTKIRNHFLKCQNISVDDVLQYYFSKTAVDEFRRCFSSGVIIVPDEIRKLLVLCLREKSVIFDETTFFTKEAKLAYRSLLSSGVLVASVDSKVKFSSPIASRFINSMIFPYRSLEQPPNIFWLVERAIQRMSGTSLRNSLVNKMNDFPSETTFQHHILEGLQCNTPVNCCILPELSRLLPEIGAVGAPKVRRRCDFYLSGDLRWLIELLINGDGINEHLSRMENGGKYDGLSFSDYIVVDFRGSSSGKPTKVQRSEHRLTVFFKLGDYSRCTLLCGLDESPRDISLEN
jgi:hypothetical protein